MRPMLTTLLVLIGVALGFYVLMCAFLYFEQDRVLFHPLPNDRALVERWAPHRVEIPSGNHALEGWWANNSASTSNLVAIYFGGNAEDVLFTASTVERFDVSRMLVVNYRGYGRSPGTPSQDALYEDALAIYDYVIASGVAPSNIVVMGRSLGSGLASMLAAEREVRAAILITPYDSLTEVAAHHYPFFPVRLLLKHPFDSTRFAQKTKTPVLIVAAEHDAVIPPMHARRLHDVWAGPKQLHILNGADHNDVEAHPAYDAYINAFLAELHAL